MVEWHYVHDSLRVSLVTRFPNIWKFFIISKCHFLTASKSAIFSTLFCLKHKVSLLPDVLFGSRPKFLLSSWLIFQFFHI